MIYLSLVCELGYGMVEAVERVFRLWTVHAATKTTWHVIQGKIEDLYEYSVDDFKYIGTFLMYHIQAFFYTKNSYIIIFSHDIKVGLLKSRPSC